MKFCPGALRISGGAVLLAAVLASCGSSNSVPNGRQKSAGARSLHGSSQLPFKHVPASSSMRHSGSSPVSNSGQSSSQPVPAQSAPIQSSSSSPQRLGASALGPLASDLSPGNQQIVLQAMDQLPASAAGGITQRLDGLTAGEAGSLGVDLSQVLGSNTGYAQAYVDALTGAGSGNGAVQAVTASGLDALAGPFQSLPSMLANEVNGNTQIASFVSKILSTTVPYIQSLVGNGLAQVSPQAAPLLLVAANRALTAINPANLGYFVALMEDSQAQALATQTAYQAGLACGATLSGTCSTFDQWVLDNAGLKTAPAPIQQDIVNCLLLPLCSTQQYQAILDWIGQVAADSAAESSSIDSLSAEMQANSYTAAVGWIDAF